MSGQIITQQGDPVEDKTEESMVEEPPIAEDIRGIVEDINDGIKGFRKFRNSLILKVGAVAVAIKIVDVVGRIIIENQRLKAGQKPEEDDE